jgi:hypothetical protein
MPSQKLITVFARANCAELFFAAAAFADNTALLAEGEIAAITELDITAL